MKKLFIVLCILFSSLFCINPIKELIYANANNKVNLVVDLTLEQAKELLIKYNNKVDYIYQGDANDFEYLKLKKLQGYVFLPDVDTDIGYFVDKQTSNIYFFHPSGYLELVK
ncbi:hypothetical protein [Romboutsia sp. 13368]|uniref:hypothetical protein n=1 Tax=Romboutsia sp. 13368 TaxID=2708053 RepID=UPI0025FF4307|nr:hypothetical protein [Romboutsia sp. 13368]